MSPLEFLADHTYRTVFIGVGIIGLVSGALGSFAYLRKQSLISDVISHAALPGTLLAFLAAATVWQGDGRNMLGLIIGAILIGTLAVGYANQISRGSKIRIDTAMAIALTVFFGAGMLLMRIIANGPFPGKGGIQDYLFGNASVMTRADVVTSALVGGAALAIMLLFFKEFVLRTFDAHYATVLGYRAATVDTLLFTVIVIATVIGVKAVGLVLMVAFLITPPAAARQWTRSMPAMVALSAVIGAVGSCLGAYLSIAFVPVPTGPLIVLTLFAIFVLSLLAAPGRSVVLRAVKHARARRLLTRELETVAAEGRAS